VIDTEYRRRVVDLLGALVRQGERIADALERANANDPIDAINRALAGEQGEAEPQPTADELIVRGGTLPEDERWRLR
jgi:hypothetical protein